LPYEADGVVIKVNGLAVQDSLGVVGRDPRGMLAFKFAAREATTRLKALGINVGRTGTLNPFAILEPVDLGGVTIERATLHNFDDIARKDIRVGDTVLVKRAGDVIPQVERPLLELRSGDEQVITIPQNCPACGAPALKAEGEVAVYCVNPACPAQVVQRIIHWASVMDMEGFGERLAQLFVEHGLLHDLDAVHGEVLAWLERQITEHGPQSWAALDLAMADEPWAQQARGWLKAVVADEEHGFEDLQRVLQRMWINALGEDADTIASSGPDAEGLARLRQLRERIASLKASLTGAAGQTA